MALSNEEQVLLDHLLAKQREEKEKNPEKYKADAARAGRRLYVFKVLDASGSMGPYVSTTVGTYNETLDALKEAQADVTVTLIEFSDYARVKHTGPFASSPRLSNTTYRPGGMTALRDAIGLAFEEADKLAVDYDTSFLLEILTDGAENSSTKYSAARIRQEISRRKESGKWTITVMGPHGSIDIFTSMGIDVGNIAQFDASSERSRGGVTRMMQSSAKGYVQTLNNSIGSVSVNTAYASVAGTAGAADVDEWLNKQATSGNPSATSK